jgi:hypothetical protein
MCVLWKSYSIFKKQFVNYVNIGSLLSPITSLPTLDVKINGVDESGHEFNVLEYSRYGHLLVVYG